MKDTEGLGVIWSSLDDGDLESIVGIRRPYTMSVINLKALVNVRADTHPSQPFCRLTLRISSSEVGLLW